MLYPAELPSRAFLECANIGLKEKHGNIFFWLNNTTFIDTKRQRLTIYLLKIA
jgi:hypothetical protein